MRALLDTHTFLWAITGDKRLSRRAQEIFAGPSDLWFSVVSVWEILIKVQIGKLDLPVPAGRYILKKLAENKIETLPISLDHVLKSEALPMHHRDPFDRMVIAQSLTEDLPLVTADPHFEKYQIHSIW